MDFRSLTRINYSKASRDQAAAEVEYLRNVRAEVVRHIEERRAPLVTDRDLAREMVDVLQTAYELEQRTRARKGETMPEAKYERHQINTLEPSAETQRAPAPLKEVQEWEKKHEPEINWEGRAVAREMMSGVALHETRERLQRFLESKRIASLNLGDNRTGTLREIEARTLTDYVARALESYQQRDYRHSINVTAREQHGRLITDFEKAKDYYSTARELASEARGSDPQFTDKERINLGIYAERQDDDQTRQEYLQLARDDGRSAEREVASARDR